MKDIDYRNIDFKAINDRYTNVSEIEDKNESFSGSQLECSQFVDYLKDYMKENPNAFIICAWATNACSVLHLCENDSDAVECVEEILSEYEYDEETYEEDRLSDEETIYANSFALKDFLSGK